MSNQGQKIIDGQRGGGKAFADFARRYVNDEKMDDAVFRSLIRSHPSIAAPSPVSASPTLASPPVVAEPMKRWPFVETPGEFTDRLEAAMRHSINLLAAVRTVLIEEPPTLAAPVSVPTKCFECDTALIGPLCPKCNPVSAPDEVVKALREARVIVADMVQMMRGSHTVLFKGDPDFGKIDPEFRAEFEAMEATLANIDAALRAFTAKGTRP